MFHISTSFNSDVSSWDVSRVTNMYGMFYKAYAFDQSNLCSNGVSWDLSGVTITDMFTDCCTCTGCTDGCTE